MNAPLADRLRPVSLDDMVGQEHLLKKGMPLYNIINSGSLPNLIFYGPPGTGKTTLAGIIAEKTEKSLRRLNGTTSSTSDIRDIISEINTLSAPGGILLYLDEIQYFTKKQQQTLLEFLENGDITLIASTTENPYFYIYGAILSRSTVFEFKPIDKKQAEKAVIKAFSFLEKERGEKLDIEKGVIEHIASASGGDVRKAINACELSVLAAENPKSGAKRKITLTNARSLTQKASLRYDRDGDEHYDILSAFQKSMRGSDTNAALHYLARLLIAGDLPSAVRRLIVTASEDVGLSYPNIIPIVKAAADSALMVGLPEARIPLANAVILICSSPKSNSACVAIDAAMDDIRNGKTGAIPRTLQNKHFDGEDTAVKGQFYKYPHSFENHWVSQQYLPDTIKNSVYYVPGDNKNEQAAKEYWDKIKNK
ncbi:MAG: replication-associated recombination protein A [Clostridiales bacterium]|jgi:putative ATPase|nr:replication-associated recombination protein A [Clostridiales bacterium]